MRRRGICPRSLQPTNDVSKPYVSLGLSHRIKLEPCTRDSKRGKKKAKWSQLSLLQRNGRIREKQICRFPSQVLSVARRKLKKLLRSLERITLSHWQVQAGLVRHVWQFNLQINFWTNSKMAYGGSTWSV